MKVIRCEVYSRIVGYYRPVQDWHYGKKEEFRQRYFRSNIDIERLIQREDDSHVQDSPR